MLKRLAFVLALGAVLGTLGACGKMRSPDQPPGSTFPRTYPMPE